MELELSNGQVSYVERLLEKDIEQSEKATQECMEKVKEFSAGSILGRLWHKGLEQGRNDLKYARELLKVLREEQNDY